SGNHENARAGQSVERLAQTICGERIERIDEHDIDLALETPVLKAVVQNKVADIEAGGEHPANRGAIGANTYGREARSEKNLRFVARLDRRRFLAGRKNNIPRRLTPITAGQDG